ncbi:Protein CBG22921 [Caenorhabditis briggsae]|uniref:Protein CBG22921 n=1 Tax=Caenorhabditis briggsae TaxID=6238 RepID=A8Y3N5_CAEBR|nr:Protein CBG22921 [Caenorhabditis briggsae]CAP39504.2 Protein CBG22921 [Caenorhabditis briggsae]
MLEIPKLEEPDDDGYGIDCSRISNFEITKFEEPDGHPDTQTDIPIFSVSNEILNDNLRTFPKKPEKRRRNDTDNDGEEEEDGIVKQDPKNWTSKEAKRHENFLENQKFDLSRRGIVLVSKLCKSELTESEVNRLETLSNSTFTIYDVPGRGGFYKIEIKGSTGPEDVRKACDVIDAFCWHTIEENFRKFGVQQEYWCHIPEKVQRSRDFKEKMLGLIMKTGVRCLTYRKSWSQHNDPIHFYGYPDMLKNAKNALDKIVSDFYHQKIYKIEAKFVGEVMGKQELI